MTICGKLLGKAKRSAPSPFFVAKVVAAARRGRRESEDRSWRNWLRYGGSPGHWPVRFAVFSSLIFFGLSSHHPADLFRRWWSLKPSRVISEVIADLDVVMSSEEIPQYGSILRPTDPSHRSKAASGYGQTPTPTFLPPSPQLP